jgi:hypothetical protein
VDPAYEKAGNTTASPKGEFDTLTRTYDAWNRPVEVKAGANVVQQNEYDGPTCLAPVLH